MRRIFALAAAFALTVSAFAQEMVNRTFDFGEFDGIKAGYVHTIYLSEGKSNRIEVSFPKRFEEYLDYGVSGGILNLGVDVPNRLRIKEDEKFKVWVQMEDISLISLSGASGLIPSGEFRGKEVVIKMSGASKVEGTLRLVAESLRYGLSGASEASVSGRFGSARGEISGASELKLKADAEDLEIQASGASECDFSGKTGRVSVECSGASEVELTGSAVEVSIECSGASAVNAEEMVAENATASASGASSIKVYGDNRLELSVSGGSAIKYYGAAKELRMSNKGISRGR